MCCSFYLLNPAAVSCTCSEKIKETAFECFAGDRGCGTGAMIPMDELGPGKTAFLHAALQEKKMRIEKNLTIHNHVKFPISSKTSFSGMGMIMNLLTVSLIESE